ncbi:PqqD family protein [Abyssisolibacter fermentans]|uniref:PqqD family protein n=1 Tax=Abyssisolibacter fermentans TaxID=1766203 RepID=UPI000833D40E|nr:PqqD family protein [Abyssisolibacter fermentans]
MKLTIKSKPIRCQLLWKYTEDDRVYIVYKPNCISLNLVGSLIWEYSNGDMSIEQLGELVCEEFKVNKNRVEVIDDVLRFCQNLLEKDLIYVDEFEEVI